MTPDRLAALRESIQQHRAEHCECAEAREYGHRQCDMHAQAEQEALADLQRHWNKPWPETR